MCYERRRAEACVDESAHHAHGTHDRRGKPYQHHNREILISDGCLAMMMILLLFLQKQNLAFAVYQFGSVLSLPD